MDKKKKTILQRNAVNKCKNINNGIINHSKSTVRCRSLHLVRHRTLENSYASISLHIWSLPTRILTPAPSPLLLKPATTIHYAHFYVISKFLSTSFARFLRLLLFLQLFIVQKKKNNIVTDRITKSFVVVFFSSPYCCVKFECKI